MALLNDSGSTTAAPLNSYSRYISVVYAIYVRELDSIKLADEFRYERYTEKTQAYKALADKADTINRYLILEEYSVLDG